MSLEATLALAVKKYRNIVDSRRFIPLASEEEFKTVFDEVLCGLTENLTEPLTFDEAEGIVKVDGKGMTIATDILKLLIILKHFINEPVYADETLHTIFDHAVNKPKIISASSDIDDHKAKKRFETFLVNLYVLLCEDESLKPKATQFFGNLTQARLQVLLLEAAPRASQEELYRKSYRPLLLGISPVNETVGQIIKRLDIAYPEPQLVEGLNRKDFLLERLGWKQATVYQCADQLHKNIIEACKRENVPEAVKNLEHFWILLDECKFVAVDECCATLFIFPSECESFIKASATLHQCLSMVSKLQISDQDAAKINEINKGISSFVFKLVRALSQNFIHFERDLNNRNSRSSNKLLAKVVLELSSLSTEIHETLLQGGYKSFEIAPPAANNKLVAEFIDKIMKLPVVNDDLADVEVAGENIGSAQAINNVEDTIISDSKHEKHSAPVHSVIPIGKSESLENTRPKASPAMIFWSILALALATVGLIIELHHLFNKPNKR